jgi:tetratricopeptide (TPR) repeat protein
MELSMQQWFKMLSLTLLILVPVLQETALSMAWEPYYDLGGYAYFENNLAEAESNLLKALDKAPDNEQVHHLLGRVYLKKNQLKAARSHLDAAWQKNQNLPGLAFDRAMVSFRLAEYETAAGQFSDLGASPGATLLADYYAGVSFYRQGRFAIALKYLLTAAKQNGSIRDNGYFHAGLCYLEMGETKKAEEKFSFIAENGQSRTLRTQAENRLAAIRKNQKASRPYRLSIRAGYGYDDNVPLTPLDKDYYSDEDDTFAEVRVSGSYDFIKGGGYLLGAGLDHYRSWHQSLNEFDISCIGVTLYGLKQVGAAALGFSYTPELYYVGGDEFLVRHRVVPQFLWRIREPLRLRFSYGFSDNDYKDISGQDGYTHELTSEAFWKIGADTGKLRFLAGYEKNNASSSEYSFRAFKTGIGFTTGLPMDFSLDVTGVFEAKDYDHKDSHYKTKREDTLYAGGVVLSRRCFFSWMTLSAQFRYERNNANIDDFDYRRKVTSLFMSADF